MNEMRILHVTKKYPDALGGDAEVVSSLEKQQKMQNHEVFIITSNCFTIRNKKNVFKLGVRDNPSNLDRISIKRFLSLIFLLFFGFKNLKRIRPDIIHSHSVDMGFVISLPARFYRIPVIHTCHYFSFPSEEISSIKKFLEKFCLKYGKFKNIITVDKKGVDFLKEFRIKNVIYIPNGVDIKRFNKITVEKDEKKIKFLYTGRLEKQKGIEHLFEACVILRKINKNFKVLLVGDGSRKKHLEGLNKKLNLNNHVFFLGKLYGDDLVRIYHESHVFILPSLWEGLPLTLLEAWASGLPVIVTDVGGIPDVCMNEENGLIVPPKNPQAISSTMLALIKNGKLRKKLGKNGRETVEKHYSWVKISRKIEGVYESITEEKI